MHKPVLSDITVAITNQCQLHCQGCGIWNEPFLYQIAAPRFVRMMQNLLNVYTIRFVSVTGGEPFLHPAIGGILRSLSVLKARQSIHGYGVYTNGACFSRVRQIFSTMGDKLSGVEIGISVDGDALVHDTLRGPGSYRATLKTVAFLTRHSKVNVDVELKFTINRRNYHLVRYVYDLAQDMGARFSPKIMEQGVTSYYHRLGDADSLFLAELTEEMRLSVCSQIEGIIKEGGKGLDLILVRMLLRLLIFGRKAIQSCSTPGKSLFITAQGDVYPCLYMGSVGKIDPEGRLPETFLSGSEEQASVAQRGNCPGCFAYHGFLKPFNAGFVS